MSKIEYEVSATKKDRAVDYMTLFEFGFTDFVVNEYLLEKYDNMDIVAEMLMSGQVDLKTINQIHAKSVSKKQK